MPTRRLYLGRIQRSETAPDGTLDRSFLADILQALEPSNFGNAYGRTWYLSQFQLHSNRRYIWGKLGFTSDSGENAVRYNDATHDFEEVPGTGNLGAFVHYVVDLDTQNVVFEDNPPNIDRFSFRVGMRSLLRNTAGAFFFTFDFISDSEALDSWLQSADRVASFRVAVRTPNPHLNGDAEVAGEWLREMNAGRVGVTATARSDESVSVNGSDLRALADYAAAGHGRVQASGVVGGEISDFDSDHSVRSRRVQFGPDFAEAERIELMIQTMGMWI